MAHAPHPRHRRESRRDNPVRHLRVAGLLQAELQHLFDSEIHDPVLRCARVNALDLHGSTATVHLVAAHPPSHDVALALQRATPWLRVQVCQSLQLQRTPLLRFVLVNAGDGTAGE